ncbi:hypothetical protein [Pseudomonas phage ZQG1]|nr:hypothetical protein [Pseudomonas phage ZQG1]
MAELEERYIVLKIKNLDEKQLEILRLTIKGFDIPTQECLVIEPDWPQYWPVRQSLLTDKPTLPWSETIVNYIEGESMDETKVRVEAALEIEYNRLMLQNLVGSSQQEEHILASLMAKNCQHHIKREYTLANKGDTKHRFRQCLVCGDIMGY